MDIFGNSGLVNKVLGRLKYLVGLEDEEDGRIETYSEEQLTILVEFEETVRKKNVSWR